MSCKLHVKTLQLGTASFDMAGAELSERNESEISSGAESAVIVDKCAYRLQEKNPLFYRAPPYYLIAFA
jgi:hypothetical protein